MDMGCVLSFCFAIAIVLCSLPPVESKVAIRIMPMGDSITEWQCNEESQGGYRNYLGNALQGKISFDFVGSQYGCGNHEGHSGWTIAQLQGIAADVLSTHTPDVVLIQAGTNDLFFNQPGFSQGADVQGSLSRMILLLNTTFTVLPHAKVFLSGVTYINATRCANYSQAPWHPPNCPTGMEEWIKELNSMLPTVASNFSSRGFFISFHDPNADCQFIDADYWTWGIHFSESGFKKIASSWLRALGALWTAD